MTRHPPSPSTSPLSRDSPSPSSSTCTLNTSSSTLSLPSTPSCFPSMSMVSSSTSGHGSYPSRHHISLTSSSVPARANTDDVLHTGAGAYSAVSPAGSYGSYRGTNTSSLDEGSASGRASGVSSGMMVSESSRVSKMPSKTSRVMGMTESHGTQRAVEDESNGNLPMQEGREGTSSHGQVIDEHGDGKGRGAGHAHSTSLSTVTASSPQRRGESSGIPMDGVFPSSVLGSSPSYQVQPSYSTQTSHPHHGFAQHAQTQAQALAHVRASQGHYQYAPPASGFAHHRSHPEFLAQSQRAAEPQGQARTVVTATRVPPLRASTKRPRAPKRPRPDASAGIGIGPSRGNLGESDDDSDDDEIIEWVPGLDDGGGPSGNFNFGSSGSTRTGEHRGTGGGTIQATPGLPGGRKCVSLLFLFPPFPVEHDVMLTRPSVFFSSFPSSFT
ncbi:hypothetical protein V8E55_012237 [Tylopilus felleus]